MAGGKNEEKKKKKSETSAAAVLSLLHANNIMYMYVLYMSIILPPLALEEDRAVLAPCQPLYPLASRYSRRARIVKIKLRIAV